MRNVQTPPDAALALPDGLARNALRQAMRMLDEAETRAGPAEMAQAQAVVGHAYRALAALPAAAAHLAQALRWARLTGSIDLVVDLQCELCDLRVCEAALRDEEQPGSGRLAWESARDHAFEASTLAHRVADSQWEVTVLLRVSDLLDRCGDHDDATQLQVRALRLIAGDPTADARLDIAAASTSTLRQ